MDSDLAWVRAVDKERSIISEAIYHFLGLVGNITDDYERPVSLISDVIKLT